MKPMGATLIESGIKEIIQEEVRFLYYEQKMTQREIAKHFGYKSGHKIRDIFDEQGWKVRPKKTDIDVDEVYRQYYIEKKTILNVAKHLGFKTKKPIERVFKEERWKTRDKMQIDSDEVHQMYFHKKMSQEEIAEYFGYKSATRIRCIFKEQGWKIKPKGMDLDKAEIWQLYFVEKKTKREIAQQLGFRSYTPITRIFKENGWTSRSSRKELNQEDVHLLYYDNEQSMIEIAEKLDVSITHIYEQIKKWGWTTNRTPIITDEDRKARRKKYQLEIHDLRDKIFGTECTICGEAKHLIHRKDGVPHNSSTLWSKGNLESLTSDEWVALCKPCHEGVHALMQIRNWGWDQIYSVMKG